MQTIEVITKEDLERLKSEIIEEIRKVIPGQHAGKKWLRSSEVRKMLGISPGTLQSLRINKSINATQFAGSSIWYYDAEAIEAILQSGINNS